MNDLVKAALSRLENNYVELGRRRNQVVSALDTYNKARINLDHCESELKHIKQVIQKDLELIKQCEEPIVLSDLT